MNSTGNLITESEARAALVHYSHVIQARGLVCATDGNLSVRLGENRILITPTTLRKEEMTAEAPIVIDFAGTVVSGTRQPSSEWKLHAEAYRRRPDIGAAIHAHPPRAIACTVADIPFDTCLLPEMIVILGRVPVAAFALPSTTDLPASISDLIVRSDAVMLARHGSITVGASLADAFKKLEKVEQAAEILMYTYALGGPKPFAKEELRRIHALRASYGITTRCIPCTIDDEGADQ